MSKVKQTLLKILVQGKKGLHVKSSNRDEDVNPNQKKPYLCSMNEIKTE